MLQSSEMAAWLFEQALITISFLGQAEPIVQVCPGYG